MIGLVLLGAALAAGVDMRRVALLTLVVTSPMIPAAGIAVVLYRHQKGADNHAALFCEGVAGELRAGSSLFGALQATARALQIDSSADNATELASDVASRLPEIGKELEATVRSASSSGSRIADLLDEIGSLAIAQAELSREVRVSTAPARVTAALFVGAPTIYLIVQTQSSGISRLIGSGGQQISGAIGLALFLAGLASAGLIMWRAR